MEARRATRLLAVLRENAPDEKHVRIDLREFTDDAELSAALRTNEHVNSIKLDFWNLENNTTNWDSLLRVIATRENLEKVMLRGSFRPPRSSITDPVIPFLLTIQQNPSVQTVGVEHIRLFGDTVASFLDNATFVTTLRLERCEMEGPAGALAVADALQRNSNIQRLELIDVSGTYLIPIVNGLTSNTTVKILKLWFAYVSLDVSLAVGRLLESTRTIERLELALGNDYDVEVDTFRPISQGLIQSTSVTDVKLERCDFDGQEVVLLLNSILASKTNLQSLTLDSCNLHEDGQAEFRAAILSLLQPHSSLRSFDLNDRYVFDTSQDFARLLTAVEASPLECFSIGTIDSSENCLALIASIPRMQVRTLELSLNDYDMEDITTDLIQAIKRNASLHTVAVKDVYGPDWLDEDDNLKLLAYTARNEFLAQWMENPNLVPKAAWSEYLAVAQTTGHDTVFRILLALAPWLGPFEGVQRRKRCRPNFYLPS
jgi:hypothetical protein